jgi:4-hydroxy-3-methylbut-2-enyl diphosphate reductase
MKSFEIPTQYRSSFIAQIKDIRKLSDPRKKDFSPTVLDFGQVRIIMARHFGFCFGVENAIEISYKALDENPGKRIFLISQMIHNPVVNKDLEDRGISFIMDPNGNMFIDWSELKPDDIIIIPAFGTTLEIEERLKTIGLKVQKYNTTCPFVERVWTKSNKLGKAGFSVIIHGNAKHEETKATFSHAETDAKSLIIRNLDEAKILGDIILGKLPMKTFYEVFNNRFSENFDPTIDLEKFGVVNQTTMLASETQEISTYLKMLMTEKYGVENIELHFADTRDTLCYATNDNQQATLDLLKHDADLAIVVGGYNSSNTSHIVELCEQKFPTFFIDTENEIETSDKIWHYDLAIHKRVYTNDYLPQKNPVNIVLTSGASCPDSQVEKVIDRIVSFYPNTKDKAELLKEFNESSAKMD